MGLGFFDGPNDNISAATGVSGDGSTVVGLALHGEEFEVFHWTENSGLTSTGVPASATATAAEIINDDPAPEISLDGSTIVGRSDFGPYYEAFRWSQSEGAQFLGDLGEEVISSSATGVSEDGSVVAGYGTTPLGREAFRWTEAGGMVGLGGLPGGSFVSQAQGISADGSTIVGSSDSEHGPQAFRWTTEEGMVGLYGPSGEFSASTAFDASHDGEVIVGLFNAESQSQPFRWTQEGGMVSLGNHISGMEAFFGTAFGVSADGSTIVGFASVESFNSSFAFLWDAEHGMRTVEDILTNDYGLDLSGWKLGVAFDVSADGRTIVGFGINPEGNQEAWIAVVPEPSTFVLAGSGLFALAVCMWRKRRGP